VSAIRAAVCAFVVASSIGASPVRAQDLARGVSDVVDGVARFSYPLRADAEICDQGITIGDSRVTWRSRGRGEVATGCITGRVSVELRVAAGTVRDVDVLDADDVPDPDAVEVGERSAPEAARGRRRPVARSARARARSRRR
jgi:hypothetical protein